MFATEKAKAEGLSLKGADYREPCPKCSPNRHKKKDPCLHVTVTSGEVRCKCFHCDWGAVFTDDDERRLDGSPRRAGLGRGTGRPAGPRRGPSRWY